MHYKTKNKKGRGFSLVELLTVIAVIGIMSGIGIANISGVNNKAKTGVDQTNARNIASLYNNAVQAGAAFTDNTNKTTIAEDLVSGVTGVEVPSTFKLGGLTDESIAAAMPYLEIDPATNVLTYKPDGDAVEEIEPEWQFYREYFLGEAQGEEFDSLPNGSPRLIAFGESKLNQLRLDSPNFEWKGYFESVPGLGMHYMIERT